eukprot:1133221-Pyramimonas_sp.AAC.1
MLERLQLPGHLVAELRPYDMLGGGLCRLPQLVGIERIRRGQGGHDAVETEVLAGPEQLLAGGATLRRDGARAVKTRRGHLPQVPHSMDWSC